MEFNKIFTVIIISILVLSSCQKDKNVHKMFPKRFDQNSYEVKSIQAFTNNGELTDQALIEKILKSKRKVLDHEMFRKDVKVEYNLSLNYLNQNEVEVIIANYKENRKIINSNSIEYLEKNEVESYTEKLNEYKPANIYKYQPIYKIEEKTHGSKLIKIKPCIYTKRDTDKVILPYVETLIFNGNAMTYERVNNEFNVESISKLKNNDTLIVRAANLIMK